MLVLTTKSQEAGPVPVRRTEPDLSRSRLAADGPVGNGGATVR